MWSTQFWALVQLKKIKRNLLGFENILDKMGVLDKESLDTDVKKKLKALNANEQTYGTLTYICSGMKLFGIMYDTKMHPKAFMIGFPFSHWCVVSLVNKVHSLIVVHSTLNN
jgi:hypothetical protein